MCGIAAIAGEKINIESYRTYDMLQSLISRGPDGGGEKLFSSCWLGHRRLAIFDLETGNQPMVDGKLAISFNGEIYNNLELRSQLEKEGHSFKTQSDTETILKAYRTWGSQCPEHLDGIFSFIIWDDEHDEMFIARDRLGQKPLYYSFDDRTILLASEIKTLIASGVVKPELDYRAIDNYLRLMYIPPWKSVYKSIFQVPPAHCGIFKNEKLSLRRYWQLSHKPINISYDEAKKEIRRLIGAAVKKRTANSDVEIGVLLSGGLDSSLVALIASEEVKYPLKAFSVNYTGREEISFSKQVCEKIGGEQFVVNIKEASIKELDKVTRYFDEPHSDTSDFPQHLLSQLASEKVKVVLSGDGADELFLGYKWHIKNKDPKSNKNIFDDRLYSVCAFTKELREELWGESNEINEDVLAEGSYENISEPLESVTVFDLTTHLPGQILVKVDRAGMMHGLEVRSPFLDIDLIDFVSNLPYEYKVRNGEQKYILKDILSEYMPHDFVFRKKQGFGSPIEKWLLDPKMKDFIHIKLGPDAGIRKILSGKSIDKYILEFYTSECRQDRSAQRVWVLLCLESWLAQLNFSYEKQTKRK